MKRLFILIILTNVISASDRFQLGKKPKLKKPAILKVIEPVVEKPLQPYRIKLESKMDSFIRELNTMVRAEEKYKYLPESMKPAYLNTSVFSF